MGLAFPSHAETLHEHLLALPPALLEDPKSAVIIPPIFLKSGRVMRRCHSLESCFTKEGGYAHMLVQEELFSVTDSLVTEIDCFPWRLQEPSERWGAVT